MAPVRQLNTTASQTTTSAPESQQLHLYSVRLNGQIFKATASSIKHVTPGHISSDAKYIGEGGRLASVHFEEKGEFLQSLLNGSNYWMVVTHGFGLMVQSMTMLAMRIIWTSENVFI